MRTRNLTSCERQLVKDVAHGEQLTCSQLRLEQLADSDDEQHTLRAEVIRDILIGRLADHPDPHGVRLAGARVTGVLDLDGVRCSLGLDLRQCWLDRPITARFARLPQLTLSGSRMPALDAEGLQVDGSVVLSDVRITGDNQAGGIRLYGAHIGGDLNCDGAQLHNQTGPALKAESLQVGGSVLLRNGFSAKGNSKEGSLRLVVARIGNSLVCEHAQLDNTTGSALRADGLQVGGSVLLRDCFHATGHGGFASVRMVSARIDGGLDFRQGRIRNPDGLALDLRSASVGWLRLPADVACRSGDDDPWSWNADGQLRLDGLTYTELILPKDGGASLGEWLHLLGHQTPAYSAQPYQHLAAFHREAGNEADARHVLIAHQRRRRKRLRLAGRLWGLLLDALVGYGYRTWQAGLWLLGFLLMGWLVFALAYPAQMTPTKQPGEPLPHFQPLAYALDTLLPVVDLRQQDNWIPSGLAQWWAWISILAGWILTTAVVAALTGLIKKD
jgi:hypothetical protein